jgi:hypothetical protein
VNGVLSAKSAVLLHFETVGVILLVLHGVVVSLLALGASQCNFNAHIGTSLNFASLYHSGYQKFSWRRNYLPPSAAEKGAQKQSPFSQVRLFYHRNFRSSTIFSFPF